MSKFENVQEAVEKGSKFGNSIGRVSVNGIPIWRESETGAVSASVLIPEAMFYVHSESMLYTDNESVRIR